MRRHRATTPCPGIGPPRDDGPCDGVERIGWQPDFYRIAILLWVERYHPELLLPGLQDEIILARTQFPWAGRQPTDDDEFDAAVAYLLGSLYLRDQNGAAEGERTVTTLGDRFTGSFLLPAIPGLEQKWCAWVKNS